jgi:hypothetical protein
MSTLEKMMIAVGLSAVVVLLAPNLALGAPAACAAGVPTAASYNWDFPREASSLLREIRADAEQVQDQAELLRRYSLETSRTWESHADTLMAIRDKVNEMGSKLCRLETIRASALPWQREAIDRAAVMVREMAANTKQAIDFLNQNQDRFFDPEYRQYAANLDQESTRLSQTIGEFEQLAKVRQRERRLDKELGYQAGG